MQKSIKLLSTQNQVPHYSKTVIWTFRLVFFVLLLNLEQTASQSQTDKTSMAAFAQTFVRRDQAKIQSANSRTMRWVFDVMDRQGIPVNASALRDLDDHALLAVGMRAAVSGISHWRREKGTDRIVVNDKTGIPYQANMVLDLEVPVYLTIICIMACTVILQHMRLHGTGVTPHVSES